MRHVCHVLIFGTGLQALDASASLRGQGAAGVDLANYTPAAIGAATASLGAAAAESDRAA